MQIFPPGKYYHRYPQLQRRPDTVSIRAGSISVWREPPPPQGRPDWPTAGESNRSVHQGLEGSCAVQPGGEKGTPPCALSWPLAVASRKMVFCQFSIHTLAECIPASLSRSSYFLDAPGLESRKMISMSSSVSTVWPASKVSEKRHCRTAFMAAATRTGEPLTDCKLCTAP